MAVFDPKSRYVKNASTYEARDRRGRQVIALTVAGAPVQTLLGQHLLREGQRLDHLANFYLEDPYAFWRIAEQNNAMLPDALSEADVINIPTVL